MDDLRKRTLKRHEALKKERGSWDNEWRDISKHVLPSTGRFLSTDRNKGKKQFNRILDNEATRAVRTLGAGMMSGMTSPARPWFKLETAPELMDSHAVKVWLDEVTQRLHTVFYRANVYNALQTIYEELAVYGTAACISIR